MIQKVSSCPSTTVGLVQVATRHQLGWAREPRFQSSETLLAMWFHEHPLRRGLKANQKTDFSQIWLERMIRQRFSRCTDSSIVIWPAISLKCCFLQRRTWRHKLSHQHFLNRIERTLFLWNLNMLLFVNTFKQLLHLERLWDWCQSSLENIQVLSLPDAFGQVLQITWR